MPWPRSPSRCRARSSTSRTSFTPGAHRAELLEGLARVGRDGLGERGLARAGRAPEDHRREAVGLDERPQRLARRRAAAPGRRCRRACGAAGGPPAARWPPARPPPPRRTGRQASPRPYPTPLANRPTTLYSVSQPLPPSHAHSSPQRSVCVQRRNAVISAHRRRRRASRGSAWQSNTSAELDAARAGPARARHQRPGGRGPGTEPKAALGRGATPALGPAGGAPRMAGSTGDLAPGAAWLPQLSADGDRVAPIGRRAVGAHPARRATSTSRSVRRDQPRLRPPAIAHRILDLHPELAVERAGMRITDPVRTIIDLGLVLPAGRCSDALSRGHHAPVSSGSSTSKRLRDALGRQGRNGTGRRSASCSRGTPAHRRPEESVLEKRLRRPRSPPRPARSWRCSTRSGTPAASSHGSTRRYPELKLAIEVDGFEHHSSPDAFQRDRTRQNRLVALGWTVLRFTWERRRASARRWWPRRSAMPSGVSPPPDHGSVCRSQPHAGAERTQNAVRSWGGGGGGRGRGAGRRRRGWGRRSWGRRRTGASGRR